MFRNRIPVSSIERKNYFQIVQVFYLVLIWFRNFLKCQHQNRQKLMVDQTHPYLIILRRIFFSSQIDQELFMIMCKSNFPISISFSQLTKFCFSFYILRLLSGGSSVFFFCILIFIISCRFIIM